MTGKMLHHSVKASQGHPARTNLTSFSDMNKNYAGHSLARHYETAGLKKQRDPAGSAKKDAEAGEKSHFGGWKRTQRDSSQTGGLGEVIPNLGAALSFATSPSARGKTPQAAFKGKSVFASG